MISSSWLQFFGLYSISRLQLLPRRGEEHAEKQNPLSARKAVVCLCSELDPFLQSWTIQTEDWPTWVSPLTTCYSSLHFPAWTDFKFSWKKELKLNPGLPNHPSNLRGASPSFLLPSVSWEVFWVLTPTVAPNKNEVILCKLQKNKD